MKIPKSVPYLQIITTVAFIDDTGCLYEPMEIQETKIISSVNEWKRIKGKNFWRVLALLLIDSFLPSKEHVDEITGHVGYRFGRKTKGK